MRTIDTSFRYGQWTKRRSVWSKADPFGAHTLDLAMAPRSNRSFSERDDSGINAWQRLLAITSPFEPVAREQWVAIDVYQNGTWVNVLCSRDPIYDRADPEGDQDLIAHTAVLV